MVILQIVPKGMKYTVKDLDNRVIYNMKKSSLVGKIHILDASGYKLYQMTYNLKDKKPVYKVLLNDKLIFEVQCTSKFLDPGFKVVGENISWDIVSSNRREFKILNGEEEIGRIESVEDLGEEEPQQQDKKAAKKKPKTEPMYILEIEPSYFDDYVPLLAACIEETFGKMNRSV